MQDPFLRSSQPLPLESAVSVTAGAAFAAPGGNPNKATRAVLAGGAGTLIVTMADGSTATLTLPATACGVLLPIAITAVAAGSTATGIVAFY